MERIAELEKREAERSAAVATLSVNVESALQITKHVTELESSLSVVKTVNRKLITEQDDLQQYSRRLNIRIENIKYDDNESQDDLTKKVKDVLDSVGVSTDQTISRLHRSTTPMSRLLKRLYNLDIGNRVFKPRKRKRW